MGRKTLGIALVVLSLVAVHAAGADYQAGQQALDAGNVDEALAQWRVAADAGDSRAMLALGRLHVQGLGVLQSYVDAHMWFNLAASRGEAAAVEERDALAEKMTPAQIATAQERAMEWQPGGERAQAPVAPATPSPAAPPAAPDSGPPPPRAIREAQALLGALGYRPGPADGIWGRRTGAAYRAFLRDAGLPDAETLTPEALRALRAVAKRSTGRGTTASAGAAGVSSPTTASRPAAVPPDALHRAARAGDIEGLKRALAAGVDVDARDGRGWTALMHAVNQGWTLLVPVLLQGAAVVDMRAPDGATALFMAAVHGHTEIAALLMKAGADISIRGPQGQTAVDVARARYGEPDAARESGVDPAVLALLNGRTWAEVAAEVRRKERFAREWPRGKKFRDCAVCPEMVVVPAGSFMMGSPGSEEGRYSDEGPVHEVTIAEPFAVGVYEVTRGEWSRFVSETGHSGGDSCWTYERGGWKERSGRDWRSPGFAQTDGHPVVCVSWHDAREYVEWLSRETSEGYRLPSEAEWEYVARGGQGAARYWGESEGGQCRHANGAERAWKRHYGDVRWTTVSCDDGHVHTAPAGSFGANGHGLHDVMGNVWEWVEDCWHEGYGGAPVDGSVWISNGDCSKRVLRGGSWSNGPRNLRSANRSWVTTAFRNVNLGFRVARTLAP